METFDINEILKNALDKGIINISDVQTQLQMSKLKEVLETHPYKIWLGDNGFWYTYIPDEKKSNGRRLIKKKTEDKIHIALLEYYESEEKKNVITFRDCFLEYQNLKSEIVSNNTLDKYESDYSRFFKDTWLDKTDITKVLGDKLEVFIIKQIKDLELNQKAMKSMIGYIRSVFMHAMVNKKIKENPCDFLKKNANYSRYCSEKLINAEDRIANSHEIALVKKQINQDHIQKPNYIPSYAVELAILTGMRVGELAALKWSSIDDNMIIIDKEEIYDRKKNLYYVANYPKNRRPRIIPITTEIRNLLDKIKEIEMIFHYYGEYVFMNEHGRINKRTICDCARNKSFQAGLDKSKSIHCYRRTVNSTMKCDGISATVASSILGNTEEVNNQYYTYDITDIDYKREILENTNKKMLSNYK